MAQVLQITGRILAGPDDVRDELWVIDGKVRFGRPSGAHDVLKLEGWVLPGLVDAHCHVGLDKNGAVEPQVSQAQAIADRDRGTLLIRDAGSPADTRWVDQREDLPKIIRAGRHIARTRRYIRNFAYEIEPEELPALMAEQARISDGWVKFVGDWIDRDTGDLAPSFPKEAVAQGIAAAHAEGARVTAHCFSHIALTDLVQAGIDCVEHATGITEEQIGLFAAKGVAVVPTLVNIATFPKIAASAQEKFPGYHDHMLALHENRYRTIGAAYEAGVPIYCGTDAGGSLAHGLVPDEVLELTKAGLSNVAALDAACWAARTWLGRPGLHEGEDADLVIYREDPRQDVRVLADPAAIVLRGKQIRRAG